MASESVVQRWLDIVNQPLDEERITSLFAPDARVVFFKDGKGRESVEMVGHGAITTWFRNMPEGRFRFEADLAQPCDPHPDLPRGDTSRSTIYRVIHPESDFRNEGTVVFHLVDDRVVGWLQAPEPVE